MAIGVSIHASAREATFRLCGYKFLLLFQSTPPRGRRLISSSVMVRSSMFQSTPPRGRRRNCRHSFGSGDGVSIHASAREATAFVLIHCSPSLGFNPRLREGGDAISFISSSYLNVSIHASAREATALITKIHLKHHISF